MKKIGAAVLLTALAGCSTTGGIAGAGGPTVAACIPVVLQDAQNIRQLEGGLTAVQTAPVTVMPPPVMVQPPPVVVTPPAAPGMPPTVTPAPIAPTPPIVTSPGPSGPGGPIVTPNARRHADVKPADRPNDLHVLFGPDGHLKDLKAPQLPPVSDL